MDSRKDFYPSYSRAAIKHFGHCSFMNSTTHLILFSFQTFWNVSFLCLSTCGDPNWALGEKIRNPAHVQIRNCILKIIVIYKRLQWSSEVQTPGNYGLQFHFPEIHHKCYLAMNHSSFTTTKSTQYVKSFIGNIHLRSSEDKMNNSIQKNQTRVHAFSSEPSAPTQNKTTPRIQTYKGSSHQAVYQRQLQAIFLSVLPRWAAYFPRQPHLFPTSEEWTLPPDSLLPEERVPLCPLLSVPGALTASSGWGRQEGGQEDTEDQNVSNFSGTHTKQHLLTSLNTLTCVCV